MLRTEESRRVISPRRREDDLRASALKETIEACQQYRIDNIRQLPRIRCLFAIENAINIQEDNLHAEAPPQIERNVSPTSITSIHLSAPATRKSISAQQ